MSQSKREELEAKIQAYAGVEIGPPEVARDEVNEAMIRQWCDALGDENQAYTDRDAAAKSLHGSIIAPPTMMQAWILPGFEMSIESDEAKDKQRELHMIFDSYGYTGVVATNCEQGYTRSLHPGDRVKAVTTIETLSEQKATGLGTGYFINTRTIFSDQNDEEVGWMTFRVLKFIPADRPAAAPEATDNGAPAKPQRIKPALGHDNQWWWEGVSQDELRIQKCSDCGALRHPPRPMCGECQSIEWGSIVASGKGTVYSYVVMHYPQVPGYEYPLAIAVVDMEEGTRFVGNVMGCDTESIEIGMPVQARMETFEGDYKMPVFYPA